MNKTGCGKGLTIIYTGDGKGKTTAALGSAVRAAGHGLKVIVIQFIKGDPNCGEHFFAAKHRLFEVIQLAEGNSFTMSQEELRLTARKTLEYAKSILSSGEYRMVILDEILVAVGKGLLDTSEVVDLVKGKPESVDLILTGRQAPAEMVEIADLVTEMRMVKHPFTRGIPARRGIEY